MLQTTMTVRWRYRSRCRMDEGQPYPSMKGVDQSNDEQRWSTWYFSILTWDTDRTSYLFKQGFSMASSLVNDQTASNREQYTSIIERIALWVTAKMDFLWYLDPNFYGTFPDDQDYSSTSPVTTDAMTTFNPSTNGSRNPSILILGACPACKVRSSWSIP